MVVLFAFATFGWEYTNTVKFCGLTCHTMPPQYETQQHTRQNESVRTIVLFSGVSDVSRAWAAGFRFKTLNIGNLYSENCKMQCSTSVCLADEDMDHIRFLLDSGVRVELRSVPSDRVVDFRDLLGGGRG
jgi:mannose/fructose/N-acetylgalactosamine-specific phosphotransferase system component IIB